MNFNFHHIQAFYVLDFKTIKNVLNKTVLKIQIKDFISGNYLNFMEIKINQI